MPAFDQLARGVAGDNRVVVGFTNMGYAHFATNMVRSLHTVGVRNIVLVAMDPEAADHFADHQGPCTDCCCPTLLLPELTATQLHC